MTTDTVHEPSRPGLPAEISECIARLKFAQATSRLSDDLDSEARHIIEALGKLSGDVTLSTVRRMPMRTSVLSALHRLQELHPDPRVAGILRLIVHDDTAPLRPDEDVVRHQVDALRDDGRLPVLIPTPTGTVVREADGVSVLARPREGEWAAYSTAFKPGDRRMIAVYYADGSVHVPGDSTAYDPSEFLFDQILASDHPVVA